MFEPKNVKFDAQGLVPAIVQDFESGRVLTLAYMNRESLDITLREKRTCFWSRSRKALWRKGESSGNVQHVVAVTADCDADALLVQVVKEGPACHTGAESCFFQEVYRDEARRRFSLQELYGLIESRKTDKKEGSYTTYLFDKGLEKILKKVGEECTEVVIAAMKGDDAETVFEISDLCYHVLVLMVARGLTLADILKELEGRHVVDKKVKQETLK